MSDTDIFGAPSGGCEAMPMTLYFFHLRNSHDQVLDDAGIELEGPKSAREVALREARAIIAAEAMTGLIDMRQRIDVEDRLGTLVCRLPLTEAVKIET